MSRTSPVILLLLKIGVVGDVSDRDSVIGTELRASTSAKTPSTKLLHGTC